MKTISLKEPHASLVAMREKLVETRSWRTHYRGPIAIHVSKRWDGELRRIASGVPFNDFGPYGNHLGCVIATAILVDVIPAQDVLSNIERYRHRMGRFELNFGDYSKGRFAWLLSDIQQLPEPIPAKGSLGLWEWEGPPCLS